MSDMIDDNRFVLIKKYKQKLIEGTNISDSPEDMAAINSILFRFWQMGWLDKLEEEPHWIPVTERLPKLRHDVLLTVFFHERWNVAEGYRQDGEFMFWNHGRLDSVLDEENRVIAWMPKPEPYKGVTT